MPRHARVADHQQATVGLAADQASGALLQRDRRLGHEVARRTALPPSASMPLDARLDQRVVRRRKRQLVDQHALQRVAGHVDAFPEALRADQHDARRRQKPLQQRTLGRRALHQHLDRRSALAKDCRQRLGHLLQRAQRGGQHEGAAAGGTRAVGRQRRHCERVAGLVGLAESWPARAAVRGPHSRRGWPRAACAPPPGRPVR